MSIYLLNLAMEHLRGLSEAPLSSVVVEDDGGSLRPPLSVEVWPEWEFTADDKAAELLVLERLAVETGIAGSWAAAMALFGGSS